MTLSKEDKVINQSGQRYGDLDRLALSGKIQEICDDFVYPSDFLPDHAAELQEVFLILFGRGKEFVLKTLDRHTNGIQRISDFMGHTRSQLANRDQLICPLNLFFLDLVLMVMAVLIKEDEQYTDHP